MYPIGILSTQYKCTVAHVVHTYNDANTLVPNKHLVDVTHLYSTKHTINETMYLIHTYWT